MAFDFSHPLCKQAYLRFKEGETAAARELCRRALERDPESVEALHLMGVIANEEGRHKEALEQFKKAARAAPDNAVSINALGESYLSMGSEAAAVECFRRAIEMQPEYARAHFSLGRALVSRGDVAAARESFVEALRLKPDHAQAHNGLGAVLLAQGELKAAAVHLRKALAVDPDYPEAHCHLGKTLHAQGDMVGAISEFQTAVRLRPEYGHAQMLLAGTLWNEGRFKEALGPFQEAARLDPESEKMQFNAGLALQDQGQPEEALGKYMEVVRLHPPFADAHLRMAESLEDLNRPAEALESYEKTLKCNPHLPDAVHRELHTLQVLGRVAEADQRWRQRLENCPDDAARFTAVLQATQIFQSIDDMDEQRRRLEEGLSLLEQRSLSINDPVSQVNCTNFLAARYPVNNRDVQTRLAKLYSRTAPSLSYVAPHCEGPLARRQDDLLRIGFISAFFYMHPIGEWGTEIIRNFPRGSSHVVAMALPGPEDPFAKLIRQSADKFVELRPSLDDARQQVAEQKLDVLFYPEVGIHPFTYFLAFSRLAPVQCTSWGHPDTTGIPTIDYYLSSADLEPPGGDEHYSEKLVRLRGLPAYAPPPVLTQRPRPRSELGPLANQHLYLCPQALFRIHPEFDEILAALLEADPLANVLFPCSPGAGSTTQFRRRLRRRLQRGFERVHFIALRAGQEYLRLLTGVDAVLDTPHFGVGELLYPVFGLGTPVVTLPGEFARSRMASACYRKMGMFECVATDVQDYVRIALQLGRNRDWNRHIRARIQQARRVLFRDAGVLREMEQFFLNATAQAKSRM